MKLTTRFVYCCLALLITLFFWLPSKTEGLGQPRLVSFAGSTDRPQVADHGGKIDSKYDGFNHETVVTLNKMRVTCGSVKGNFKDSCVSLVAALHCPGIQLDYVRYARLRLIFQTKDWDGRHPLGQRQLSVVADGETLRLGQMKLVSQSVDTLMTEVLEVDMPYKVFTKIALAQAVEMKVGNSEFALRAQNLSALRDLNKSGKVLRERIQTRAEAANLECGDLSPPIWSAGTCHRQFGVRGLVTALVGCDLSRPRLGRRSKTWASSRPRQKR